MVRKIICINLFMLFSLLGISQEESQRALFEKGNKSYQQSEYFEAIEAYEKAINVSEEESAFLHYNLGNAYFKSEQLGKAILHFEKALKINPDHEKAASNLEIANARIVDKVQASPSEVFYKRWTAFLNTFGADNFAIVALSLLLITVAGFYLFITGKTSALRKIGFVLSIVFIALFSLGTYLSYAAYDVRYNNLNAIILEIKVDVKTEPNSNASTAFVMHEGAKISVESELEDWVEIALANGNMGWVKKQVLGFI